jgi:uncharacterized protein YsxB (DUF464 family)
LEQEDAYDIDIDEGDVKLVANKPIEEHDMTVIETLIIQLKTIETSYKGTIDIKERKD